MSVFNLLNKKNNSERNCFFDDRVNIARYDKVRYQQFEKLSRKMIGFFWVPEEVDLSRDTKDFKSLTDHEKHIFTSNLKRQILLDSVQGRAPSEAFLPICSLPELETAVQTWAFFETLHSRSYTHIIRNVYADPSKVFDGMLDIQEIVDCAKDISKYYDDLIAYNSSVADRGYIDDRTKYEHKEYLWLCLNAVNALEGIRFYVSFACSWNFAEQKKMEGNAKIIKFIARDENVHLALTQQLLKILPKEDPDFEKIKSETEHDIVQMFESVVNQEKQWAKYLFKDGSMIGLNEALLCEYIDFIAAKRMSTLGLGSRVVNNPLPWTQKWIGGSEVQVAPQEVNLSSYTLGGVKQDLSEDTFKGFSL